MIHQPDLFEPARLRRDHSPDAGKMMPGNKFSAHPHDESRGVADASPRRCGRAPLNPTGVIAARERQEPGADIRRDGGERPAQIDQRGRRATSRAAYHEVELSDREAEVMRHVLMHPGRDWTRAELARSMGWRDGPLCGRVNALVAKGRLIEGPARDCTTPGGRRGHTLRAA